MMSKFALIILIVVGIPPVPLAAQATLIRDLTTRYDYDAFGNISTMSLASGDHYVDTSNFTYQYDASDVTGLN